ncbi:MAG: hypothetical protein C4519_24380 [Desulfobacteraceae bacterium]|nr:MAG: hypothetical protein C4519_24380 [Desulfobacteraceae bacterium]
MAYELKINNLAELQAAFKKSPKIIGKELETATKNAGKLILKTEKEEVPVRTATLKRSITMDYRPISVAIYPTVKYALPVHEGSKPHTITPVRKKVLAFKIGGKKVFARRVNHPGNKPNKFVDRTVSKTDRGVNNLFDKALDAVIKFLAK